MPFSKYSAKQKKLARVAPPRNKITGADLKKVRAKKVFGGTVKKSKHRGCGAVMSNRRKQTKYS
tara:strand:- start:123 stop:314 length:192 start_codon:yes stop_codon:yes gene_type:complete